MAEKYYVSWENVEAFVSAVQKKYSETNVDGVYGLPRGGLILAVMISHKLNIPLLQAPTKRSLIVDDICDSGESLLHYFKNSSSEENTDRPVICTMFYKDNDLVIPDLFIYEKEDKWIVFPWED